ncbi:ATP-binding protein [Streptomyces sp. NPDC058374]|uniref:sensor histidine kinase n=1 Tax=unclassified Streptomyces TaxID=2593676 RepID=UPI0036610FE0
MQVFLVVLLILGCVLFAFLSDRRQAEEAAGRQAGATARAVADSPSVREAIRAGGDPSRVLQPYAEEVRRDADVDFVTIMDTRGIRWTHPDTGQIGARFLGHTEEALSGRTLLETYTGTLGPSVRVVTPIRDDGEVIGLVSAGITVDQIAARLRDQVLTLLAVGGLTLVVGGVGTYVINARLRRHTHDMDAAQLSHMYAYHQAALHAVREGLVMLDGQRRIALINDGARELLGLAPERGVGDRADALGLPAPLTGALLAAEPRVDEVHLSADRVLVVNTSPVASGEQRGTVVTLRDHTELQALTGELDSERGFSQALRSQAHEAANRLHTVVSLIELGRAEEAVEFATAELELAQTLTDQVVQAVGEPVLAALLLGKTAQANERGIELTVHEDSRLDDGVLPAELPARDLVTVLGNLVDNAMEAVSGTPGARVAVTARAEADGLLLRVTDNGPGVSDGEEVFRRGWSTKDGGGRGLGLALVRQTAERHGGTVTVGEAPGGGAAFQVRIPISSSTRSTPAGSAALPAPRAHPHAGAGPPGTDPLPTPAPTDDATPEGLR